MDYIVSSFCRCRSKVCYGTKTEHHLHTNFGASAVMSTVEVEATGVPALVITLPLMATLPCAIQDWMTLRLCSGYCSKQTSSSLLFLGAYMHELMRLFSALLVFVIISVMYAHY